jgi:hypothetical protein
MRLAHGYGDNSDENGIGGFFTDGFQSLRSGFPGHRAENRHNDHLWMVRRYVPAFGAEISRRQCALRAEGYLRSRP